MRIRGQSCIFIIIVALALTAAGGRAEPPSAREWFDSALQSYAASNYAAAATAFAEAAQAAPAARLDPASAHFNAGLAAYAARQWEEAAAHFARAASGSDLGLQAKAYYNRGNALFHLADQPLLSMGDRTPPPPALESASGSIGEAIQMYENAIALDPHDDDAKANYELALLKQQELQQMQEQQQEQQDQAPEEDEQPQPQPDSEESGEEEQPEPPQPDEPQAEDSPPDDEPDAEPQPQPEDERTDEMTREEAEMLLDALREQEQSDRDRLQPFLGQPVPVEKDW